MSKIYFKNKSEFINNVKNNINSNITFIKKYHKYEPFLDFFPLVLKDIIFEYINDIITLKYIFSDQSIYKYMRVCGNASINYQLMNFNVNIMFFQYDEYLILASVSQIYNDIILLYNEFMERHYKKELYISCNALRSLSDKEYWSQLKDHNLKQFKHEIIITKKLIKCVTKIKIEE